MRSLVQIGLFRIITMTLVIVCSCLFLDLSLSAHPVLAQAGDGSPTDPHIVYIGRWDTSSGTTATSYWGGAYFKTNFTGTTVQVHLGGTANIYASIDGGADTYYAAANGTVNLTPSPLAAGMHTLRVATRSEHDVMQFQGLTLDAGATTAAPSLSPTIIEFVGDSITAGYQNTNWALSDYAWLTGEQLHAEHTQIAYPGICLVDAVSCYSPNSIGMSRQFFKLQTVDYPSSPDWDFSRYQARAVVINLGTNDNSKGVNDTTFQQSYVSFLQNIRAKYPNADIFALRTFGGYKAAPTQAAVNAVTAAGDNKVHYVDTTGWLSPSDFQPDGVHPNDAGQQKAANLLTSVLEPIISPTQGWIKCADEHSTCSFTGTMVVRYGANGRYAYQTAKNSIACNNSIFGDPNVGVYKACSIAQLPPGGWTKCADENGACSLSGTGTVAYGANGRYTYKTATNSIACNNSTFGDPNVGVYKACYYL